MDVFHYHELTKHRAGRYARSAGYMDWENEPIPFRSFEGADMLKLPFLEKDPDVLFDDVFKPGIPSRGVSIPTVAGFLELSLALAAWKLYGGSSWALRINPSSGNLHAEEAYVLTSGSENGASLYHYNPYLHAFERRTDVEAPVWSTVEGHFGVKGFFAALSSIHWRQAWKYGERAFRYACLDIGHAVAAMSVSAGVFGLTATVLSDMSSDDMAVLLGMEQTHWLEHEKEIPQLVLFIHERTQDEIPRHPPRELVQHLKTRRFAGKPNRLSKTHMPWKIIEDISNATEKPETNFLKVASVTEEKLIFDSGKTASSVIRARRSGQRYDGSAVMPIKMFLSILTRTLPGTLPFDSDIYPVKGAVFVHLLVYVNRVEGLPKGIYVFARDSGEVAEMKRRMSPDFKWEKVTAAHGSPLFLLQEGDFSNIAAMLSCGQEIVRYGAFAVSMISRFSDIVGGAPFMYRRLLGEAGMIGQMLYLQSEAHGFRGTGIGCFFDDEVHDLLGLCDNRYQCLYNFTVGTALADSRLTTLAPYHHLK